MADTLDPEHATARVVGVQEGLITLESAGDGGASLVKNEIVHVGPRRQADARGGRPWLKGEVLRVDGDRADAQIYEDTRGVSVGDPVVQSGTLLSATLGPGLLGRVFDGLQRPLEDLAQAHGTFLPHGVRAPAVDPGRAWRFTPAVARDGEVRAGDALGTVPEGHITHTVCAPFDLTEPARVAWVADAPVRGDEPVAELVTATARRPVTLNQTWPVRVPLPRGMQRQGRARRVYPETPLTTSIRLIDTFFPVAKGGTACIPGPFGAGKTVLQDLIARYADVDVVVVVACGERAGEVVETLTEFPELRDPRTGGPLMDRTILICNTSSMPVAARESSIYTGLTIGEYYRHMGLDVLLLADSTSRWAQAMRETAGRMEEIPGEEGYPAYLDSALKAVYERAGQLDTPAGERGSLTLIGTVSPAGGNLEEPVTQATLGTVKCFLGLSAERAYKRYYPAIDPLTSWTRYREQLRAWFDTNLESGWTARVERLLQLLHDGDEVAQMMQVTGEEGVSLDDFVTHQKARVIDFAYLQQDAFDEVDAATPLKRQHAVFGLLAKWLTSGFSFADKDDARAFFTKLIKLAAELNRAPWDSEAYARCWRALEAHASSRAG